jgi:predicted kinase
MWKFPTYEIDNPINWEELESRFAWLREMRDVPQDLIWHAEGDVFTHTKMVVAALLELPEFKILSEQDKHILFAAALLHDVEKRSTTVTEILDEKERFVSPKHALKGEFTTRELLYKEISTPFHIRERIAKIVRLHGLPLWAIAKDNPRKAVIEASLAVNTAHLAMFAKADILGRICDDAEECLLKIDLFKELCLENNCWGNPYGFKSNYGRLLFLTRDEMSPDYEPFEDLKFEVTILSGLPGTGKDTYIKKYLDLPVLSLDDIRRQHKIDPRDRKGNGQVIQFAKEQAKVWMRKRESFAFNATNITRDMRGKWISLFMEYGARIKIIYLEVPYRQLLSQNHNRDYKVPVAVVNKMIRRLEIPNFREGHEVVCLVSPL